MLNAAKVIAEQIVNKKVAIMAGFLGGMLQIYLSREEKSIQKCPWEQSITTLKDKNVEVVENEKLF